MGRVTARFQQFRIASNSLFECPGDHPVGALQAVQRKHALGGIAENAHDSCLWNQGGDPLSRFRGREVGWPNFSHWTGGGTAVRSLSGEAVAIPVCPEMEMKIEKSGLFGGRRQNGVLTQYFVQPTCARPRWTNDKK